MTSCVKNDACCTHLGLAIGAKYHDEQLRPECRMHMPCAVYVIARMGCGAKMSESVNQLGYGIVWQDSHWPQPCRLHGRHVAATWIASRHLLLLQPESAIASSRLATELCVHS